MNIGIACPLLGQRLRLSLRWCKRRVGRHQRGRSVRHEVLERAQRFDIRIDRAVRQTGADHAPVVQITLVARPRIVIKRRSNRCTRAFDQTHPIRVGRQPRRSQTRIIFEVGIKDAPVQRAQGHASFQRADRDLALARPHEVGADLFRCQKRKVTGDFGDGHIAARRRRKTTAQTARGCIHRQRTDGPTAGDEFDPTADHMRLAARDGTATDALRRSQRHVPALDCGQPLHKGAAISIGLRADHDRDIAAGFDVQRLFGLAAQVDQGQRHVAFGACLLKLARDGYLTRCDDGAAFDRVVPTRVQPDRRFRRSQNVARDDNVAHAFDPHFGR